MIWSVPEAPFGCELSRWGTSAGNRYFLVMETESQIFFFLNHREL